ncbi:MAG TPA: DUF1835 domain-containing protein [Nitrospiraceae bacterium]|nr:DUF1835 domain-containing protein [Nitrospiraceae bacterium]
MPESILHIRCGDDILARLKEAGLPGDRIRWADALCQGPTPTGLDEHEWRRIRARHAKDFYGMPYDEAMEFLRKQDENLLRFRDHDEIVLWFEHDMFDQVVLIYLLDWSGRQDVGHRRVSLICPNQHLGFMDREQLAQLYPTRQPVTAQQIDLSHRAWQAFCATDPRKIEDFLSEDTSALPFLRQALIRHLQEFPFVHNGLNQTEQNALDAIASGITEPKQLFQAIQRREERAWLGDSMFWPYLEQMSSGTDALLKVEGVGPWVNKPTEPSTRFIHITDQGRRVLNGEVDWVNLRGLDRWFGGVHLQGKHVEWRWDSGRHALARSY